MTVSYTHLKYQLKGWQMLKEENAELIIDGKRVENDYTFVADDEEMKIEITEIKVWRYKSKTWKHNKNGYYNRTGKCRQ